MHKSVSGLTLYIQHDSELVLDMDCVSGAYITSMEEAVAYIYSVFADLMNKVVSIFCVYRLSSSLLSIHCLLTLFCCLTRF